MVKAAIIGCGKIAQVRHIPEYLEHQAVNLVGFYDLNEKRAEELAEKYGGKAGFLWRKTKINWRNTDSRRNCPSHPVSES